MQQPPSPYVTVREVAERERVTRETIHKALKSGTLKGHRIGSRGDWRIHVDDLEAWISAGAPTRVPQTPQPHDEP